MKKTSRKKPAATAQTGVRANETAGRGAEGKDIPGAFALADDGVITEDLVARKTRDLVYTCHTHVPLWVDFPPYVLPIYMGESQKDGCRQLNLRDLAPQWDEYHSVVGGTVAAFAFKNLLLEHYPNAKKVGVCQYRKFVSSKKIGVSDPNYQVIDLVPQQEMTKAFLTEAMLPNDEDFLIPSPGHVRIEGETINYLNNYKHFHFLEDFLRFIAEAIELDVLDKEEVWSLFNETIFFPAGSELGFFPADYYIKTTTAIESVIWACVKRFDTRRGGYQARFWGFCAERLGSYLLLKHLRNEYIGIDWPQRFFGYINNITEGEEAVYKHGL